MSVGVRAEGGGRRPMRCMAPRCRSTWFVDVDTFIAHLHTHASSLVAPSPSSAATEPTACAGAAGSSAPARAVPNPESK